MKASVITIDVDWAPDCAIDFMADALRKRSIKATWLLTHASPAVERLRQTPDLFELGIHPNFSQGSSHGDGPTAVLAYCRRLAPDATTMRSHSLVQSTTIYRHVLDETEIRTDLSLFMPGVIPPRPFFYRAQPMRLLRLPYVWEDDVEMIEEKPDWTAERFERSTLQLQILDFHPIHVFLNSRSLESYELLKMRHPINECSSSDLAPHVSKGSGTGSLFRDLINSSSLENQWITVREADALWRPLALEAEGKVSLEEVGS